MRLWLRGLIVWLGAPLVASFLCTLVIEIAGGDLSAFALRFGLGLAVLSLVFTIPGSALLALIYSGLENASVRRAWRLFALAPCGFLAGGAAMTASGNWSTIAMGAFFGTTTALAWVGLLMVTGMDHVASGST